MSNCLQCGKENPPSQGRRKRKYCSQKCANKYLYKKNYNNGEGGTNNSYTYIKKNPDWGSKTKALNERRAEFERCEADPKLFSPRRIKKETGLARSLVSLRAKLLELEPAKEIKHSGLKTYYTKEQVDKIVNFLEILRESPTETYKAYLKESKTRSKTRREEHGDRIRELRRKSDAERRKDPVWRLRKSVGRAVAQALRRQKGSKGGSTFDYLPYTLDELKMHLEGQFREGMTWDNYGEWHLDHIVPQAALPYDSLTHPNFTKCWALENLQPLWASENSSKSSWHEGKLHKY